MERVNKITVTVEEFNTRICLWRTNLKLAELTSDDFEIPPFDMLDDINKNVYINYCRDFVQDLLENGGVEGFYYEEKQSTGQQTKFSTSEFMSESRRRIKEAIKNWFDEEPKMIEYEDQYVVSEKYKDGTPKNISGTFKVRFRNREFTVLNDMKSGQVTSPKRLIYKEENMPFNMTTIKSICK